MAAIEFWSDPLLPTNDLKITTKTWMLRLLMAIGIGWAATDFASALQDEIPGTQLEAIAWLEGYNNTVKKNSRGEVTLIVIDYVPRNFAVGDLQIFPKLEALEIRYASEFQDRHMSGIAELKGLRKILIDHCEEISETTLEVLHYLPVLEVLQLRGCEAIQELEAIAKCQTLKKLDLADNGQLDFQQLENLQGLKNLETIGLSENSSLEDSHLAWLNKIRGLKNIDVSNCELITDKGLEQLVSLPLRRLNVSGCSQVTGASFNLFPPEFLETLEAADCSFDDQSVQRLRRFFRLRNLDLSNNNQLEGAGLRSVAQFQWLEEVDLSGTKVADEDLSRFSDLKSLVSVNLSGCTRISGEGLAHLRQNSKLAILKLRGCRRMEEVDDFRVIADLTSLKELDLSETRVCRECVYFLRTLPALEKLDLSGCKWIDDQSLQLLAQMKTLREIRLIDVTRLTDNGISALAASPSLRKLAIGANRQITGVGFYTFPEEFPFEVIELQGLDNYSPDGFRALARIKSVKQLRVEGVNLTDSHLNALRGMQNLEVLELAKVGKINRTALQNLKNSLPKLRN